MRNALKQLRKQRTMLDRAIRALEELEKLQAAAEHSQQTSAGKTTKTTPCGLVVVHSRADYKASRLPDTTLERTPRFRSK
jgi:hypothetical protein